MIAVTDTVSVAGISLPFFPMRPIAGAKLSAGNFQRELAKIRRTHILQPKLNGDRACVAVLGDTVRIQSRRGDWYSHTVNLQPFHNLNAGTLLDGEVWQGEFYPFEVLAGRGISALRSSVEERIDMAESVCHHLNIEWQFGSRTDGWILDELCREGQEPLTRQWEGIVAKLRGSSYRMLGAAHQESPEWIKLKWC